MEKVFTVNSHVLTLNVPLNFTSILIIGTKNGIIKMVDLNKMKIVTIQTTHNEMICNIMIIEKMRLLENDFENYNKNFNFIIMGPKKLSVYDGYG